MPVEKALIAQARPYMMAARVEPIIQKEASKGCQPSIFPHPVALEPPFRPIAYAPELLKESNHIDFIPEIIHSPCDFIHLQLWVSPKEKFSWLNSELFLKQLGNLSGRATFEIAGNNQKIQLRLLVNHNDLPIIQTAFRGQFEYCELSYNRQGLFEGPSIESCDDLAFMDYFPPPPYSHLITRPDELKATTFRSIVAGLMEIDPPAFGFYQAIFQPVKPMHNWHRNVQMLLDLEYALKQYSGIQASQKYPQQAPSGDLRQMALEVETKAHNDKPFYSMAVRLGVVSKEEDKEAYLRSLSPFLNLFQNGGRPFHFLTEKEYREVLSWEQLTEMFLLGVTYRPGFLVNSAELTGFVHIPPAKILEYRQPPIDILETLPIRNTDLYSGTPIGTCVYAGTQHPVCIPLELRSRSTHIIGKPGQTKSTTMAHMILDDIEKGMGVAVIDPHGDLVEDLLYMIKEEHVERTIYFDPGQIDYVPLWNPLKRAPGQSLSRTGDNLVDSIKSVVTGWGDRLETLLRHGLYALLHLANSTLLDLSNLLRRNTPESNRLQKMILEVVDNELARQFWRNDFKNYSNEALDPPKHKLSKLLLSDTVGLMISQPENLIDFRRIMDQGEILLINLSNIGSDEREILGCFMLSLLHLTALGRSNIPIKERKQFHIYADEAHRFITEALEDLIVETRKFGVSLTLAHHYLSQFGTKKVDALSSVGTTIIMNVDTRDAQYMTKDLQQIVNYKELIKLQKGEAIGRIGTDIVRFKTPGALRIPKQHFRDAIIKRSHDLYYKPAHIIRDLVGKGDRRGDQPFSPLSPYKDEKPEDFEYDEF